MDTASVTNRKRVSSFNERASYGAVWRFDDFRAVIQVSKLTHLLTSSVPQRGVHCAVLYRRYVEDDSPSSKKLYITEIVRGDTGNYTCSATIRARQQRKTVVLHVFSQFPALADILAVHPETFSRRFCAFLKILSTIFYFKNAVKVARAHCNDMQNIFETTATK